MTILDRTTGRVVLMAGACALIITLSAVSGLAQHLISTKAGFVNRTDGKVFIKRAESEDDERGRASLGTQMRNGDQLTTEPGSFAEILLNPGAYMRLSEKTKIRAVSTDLESARFELLSGTVIFEIGEVEKMAPLEIDTPQGHFFAKKDGLHRIDLLGNGTRIAVRQGELWYGDREQVVAGTAPRIGRGKLALFNGSDTPEISKVDRDAIDEFDRWSFNRAQTLVAANNSALRQSRSFNTLAYGWIFDSFTGGYTFIPRNGMFWSPYGFSFFNSFSGCFTCYGSFYRGLGYGYGYYGNRGNNNGVISGVSGPPASARVINGTDRTTVRREIEGRRIENSPMLDGGGMGGRSMGGAGRAVGFDSSSMSIMGTSAPSRGGMSGVSMGGVSSGASAGGAAPSAGRPSRP